MAKRNYDKNNNDKKRAWARQSYWRNRDFFLARRRRYPHNAEVSMRCRARKLGALPSWLTQKHKNEIREIYVMRSELDWLSEGGLEVDHIVPLKGKNVCGLHVPWNLRVIPREENQKKGNRLS
jgi:5-methylcytosine-specific restriction endonuclease McrA